MSQTLNQSGLQDLIQEYMQKSFEANPVNASAYLGLHEYDGRLPDLSRAAITQYIADLHDLRDRLDALPSENMDKEARFDRALLRRTLDAELFQFEDMRDWERNAMFYANVLDVSCYVKRDYAPLPQRLDALIRHLEGVPGALIYGRENLAQALPKPGLETAITMYDGMVTYYEGDVTAEFDPNANPDLHTRFLAVRDRAVAAVRDFVNFLKEERLPHATQDYAIGAEKYRRMLATGEMVDLPLEKVLEVGERNLNENLTLAREICAKHFPGVAVKDVFAQMIKNHPTPEGLVPETRAKLEAIRQFLIDRNIISVPSEVRCEVKETPPFLRWAFAFMDAPGPFEKVADEAYYYLTPVEAHWTEQQKEEWLTKFDYYTLQAVNVHEAYPGHYLHFLHTKLVTSPFRQMIWAYSFVEGWAHYTEQMMMEEGFEPEDPRYRLAQLAEALLRNSRYVVAIKMHTQGMTLDEATRFLMENAFMEETPARSEATRGTFDPGYLNYTLGKLLLLKLRQDYAAEKGVNFNLREFHDRVLAYGAPPVPLLRPMLLEHDNGEIL
jgi:uncharacterized protein (DUF885 family)